MVWSWKNGEQHQPTLKPTDEASPLLVTTELVALLVEGLGGLHLDLSRLSLNVSLLLEREDLGAGVLDGLAAGDEGGVGSLLGLDGDVELGLGGLQAVLPVSRASDQLLSHLTLIRRRELTWRS